MVCVYFKFSLPVGGDTNRGTAVVGVSTRHLVSENLRYTQRFLYFAAYDGTISCGFLRVKKRN
jgi:hypothetical protein